MLPPPSATAWAAACSWRALRVWPSNVTAYQGRLGPAPDGPAPASSETTSKSIWTPRSQPNSSSSLRRSCPLGSAISTLSCRRWRMAICSMSSTSAPPSASRAMREAVRPGWSWPLRCTRMVPPTACSVGPGVAAANASTAATRSAAAGSAVALEHGLVDLLAGRAHRVPLGVAVGDPLLAAQGDDRHAVDRAAQDVVLAHVVGEPVVLAVVPVGEAGLDNRLGDRGRAGDQPRAG